MDNVLFSSNSVIWSTPQDFFNSLNKEFHFTLDPCALPSNAKCSKFFSPSDNGLIQDWSNNVVFCNPPYGKSISSWVKKCYLESLKPNTIIVLLIPSRTDTSYFHDYILGKCELRFIRGRLRFGDSKTPAPFPSLLAIYR